MKVCIVGAGAIGGTIGARLARAGSEVSVLARGAALQAIGRDGLVLLDGPEGGRRWSVPVRAAASAAELGVQDVVVLGVKTPAIAGLLPALAPLLGEGTCVLPAINGIPWWYFHREGSTSQGEPIRCLDPEGAMLAALDPDRIVGCVVHLAGEVREPGVVHHTAGRRLILGEPKRGCSERLERLARTLADAGFQADVTDDIRFEIWTKLVGNLSFNPIAAITGYRMDQICADEDVLDVIRAMMDEGKRVAAAFGVEVRIGNEARIDMARELGAARISTLQDFEARRRPELEALLLAVIELAGRAGVPVPTIRQVTTLAEARARQLAIYP